MSAITIFTVTGRALLAAAVANGQALASARLAVGDGNGQVYAPNENQTALVRETWRGPASVARTDDLVVFQATIPANVGDFVVREVGLFLGPAGAEQLFIVSQSPSREKLAAPANGSAPMTVSIHFSANAAQAAVMPATGAGVSILQIENAPHITVDDLVTAAPANPADGQIHAIAAGATGLFAGRAGSLVERVSGTWIFRPVRPYSVIRLKSSGDWYEWVAGAWKIIPLKNPVVTWAEVTGKPAAFPPAGHSHDDLYVRLAPPGGAAQTVTGPLNVSGKLASNAAEVGGALAVAGKATAGALEVSGATVFRENVNVCYPYPQLSIQRTADNQSNMITGRRADGKAIYGIELGNWNSDNFTVIRFDQAGNFAGTPLHFNGAGAWGIDGDFGAPGMVLASRGNGATVQYRNVIDLLSAAALRARIGGKRVLAIVATTINGRGTPVTFDQPEPDTGYTAAGFGMWATSGDTTTGAGYVTAVGLGNKSINGCSVTPEANAPASPSGSFIAIVYR